MTWGTVTIGGIPFREELQVDQDSNGSIKIAGQESCPPSTVAAVMASHQNVIGLDGLTVPVVFSDKVELSGFYRVAGAQSALYRFANGSVQSATWSMTLERIGTSRDVEIESRVPTIPRLDELPGTQTPSYWHAPAVGASSYWTGATAPNANVSRVSSEGAVSVFTGIPVSVAPRWTVAASDYLLGSSRLLLDGIRRVGTDTPPHTAWELHNGLVRVQGAASGAITVSAWDSGVWASAKGYQFTATSALTSTPELSILRNDPEEVVVRLSYPSTPGRVTVDLSLRRGSRFVTGVVKRHSAATLGVVRTAAEAASVMTGGLRATAVDADGNRFVMGSTRVVTTATGTAAISKASVTAFDFFLGHEVAVAPVADEVQTVSFGGTAVGGTFTLSFGGQTTTALPYNATASAVQGALAALSSIGTGNVLVTGGPAPASLTVAFTGALAGADVSQVTASGASLVGPTKVTTATTTQGAVGTNEVQTVSFGGTITGGTFTLSFGGQTTGAIARNATAATVQTALQGLSTIGAGNIAVTGGPGPATYTLTFQGALRSTNVAQVTATSSLTGTAPTVTTATTTEGVPGTSEVQTVSFDPSVNGGTFTLTYSGQTTTALAWNASAATVTAALEALSNIGVGDAVVTGGPGPATYTVTFTSVLRDTDVPQLTANGASLTATSTPTVSTATTTQGVGPQVGDAFADLLAQYIASSGERTRIVRR